MKIQTGKKVLTLKGEAYKQGDEELLVGHVIAEALAGDRTGGKMKMYLLAQRAYEQKELDVDAADLKLIKTSVEQCTTYNNVIVGQVLAELEEVKEAASA